MDRKEELLLKTSLLVGHYWWSYMENDGSEIVKTFGEYADLVKDDPVYDKRFVANIQTIIMIYQRAVNGNEIDNDVMYGASRMYGFLQSLLECNAPKIVDMLVDPTTGYMNYDTLDDLEKALKAKGNEFIKEILSSPKEP